MFVYKPMPMAADTLRVQERPLSPGAGITSSCELPDMGAGNKTQALCKS